MDPLELPLDHHLFDHHCGNVVDLTELLRQSLHGGKAPPRHAAPAKSTGTRRKTG